MRYDIPVNVPVTTTHGDRHDDLGVLDVAQPRAVVQHAAAFVLELFTRATGDCGGGAAA